jgi:hypothetical protein
MKILHLLAATLVTVSATTAFSQASPLAGTWRVEYQRGLRNENGEITVLMGTAKLSLEQRGDSLVGQLAPEPGDDGRTPPPIQFAGASSGSSATFHTVSESRINFNEEVRVVKVNITWELSATGDALTGTMQRSMEGMEMPSEPTPIKGTRVR